MRDRSDTDCTLEVSSVRWRGHLKDIILRPGPVQLRVPLSACVAEGDKVAVKGGEAWVVCKNGQAQILGTYTARDRVPMGEEMLELVIKEITDPEEMEAHASLAELHYRGQASYGRRARLVARTFHAAHPSVIGYVELASPFYVNRARAQILDAPFQLNGAAWERWDKATTQQFIHLFVRIARCVVSPEFRGLGIGQRLVLHAADFARQRWQMAGMLPYFLEISADMLKYVPFAEKAGMVFVGETEGNLHRIYKDMRYLIHNKKRVKRGEIVSEDSCGIVDQQVARMDRALALIRSRAVTVSQLLDRLKRLSHETVLRDFDLFHGIVSLPKPTYMMGLHREAARFLRARVAIVQPARSSSAYRPEIERLDSPIVFRDATVAFVSQVRRTRRTHAVQQAFGISPEAIRSTVVRGFSAEIFPGEVILLLGPSGSGKTTLLGLLVEQATEAQEFTSELRLPGNRRLGTLRQINSRKPMIELLASVDVQAALYILGLAGLSEPFVYLKRFDELSRGQQYRGMLASLLASGANLWLLDEFCANLDPVTANVVAFKLQQAARRWGATLVVAAPHCDQFLHSLQPDKIIQLSSAYEYKVWRGDEFLRAGRRGMSVLPLRQEYIQAVRSGRKRSTIRKGRQPVAPGMLLLESGQDTLAVYATDAVYKQVRNLTAEDAASEAFDSLEELRQALQALYKGLKDNHYVTVIRFRLPCGTLEQVPMR